MATCLLVAGGALANGRYPAASQLVFSPSNSQRMLLRTTFGFLVSNDRGTKWEWVCEGAIGYSGVEDPAVAITNGNTMVAGLSTGLSRSFDRGCGWDLAGGDLLRDYVIDVSIERNAPAKVAALTSTYKSATDSRKNQIYLSEDDGRTFAPMGNALDGSTLAQTFDIAPSEPNRVYASAFSGNDPTYRGFLYVSDDRGKTWRTSEVPQIAGEEIAPYIAAIDPADSNRVYIRTRGREKLHRLLVTEDGGNTFKELFRSTNPILGFALVGNEVFVGNVEGLYRAPIGQTTFEKVSTNQIHCLTENDGEMFACSAESNGFFLGKSSDRGATWTSVLRTAEIAGPMRCMEDASTDRCRYEWPLLQSQLGITPDAGGVDAGNPDGGGDPEPNVVASGCTSSEQAQTWLGAAMLFIVSAVMTRMRRKAR